MECNYCNTIKELTEFRPKLRMCKKCQYQRYKKNTQEYYLNHCEELRERAKLIYEKYKKSDGTIKRGRPRKYNI